MTVDFEKNGTALKVAVGGRLDTLSAAELEDVESIELDLEKLEYISSAGLRVILCLIKEMEGRGEFKVTNVTPEVMDILEVTGFINLLNIE